MKRLRRKAEFYSGGIFNGKYFEVFKNPTPSEVAEVRASSELGGVRGVIDKQGTVFIWQAEVTHYDIDNYVQDKIGVASYQFRFTSDADGTWNIDTSLFFESIAKYMNELSNISPILPGTKFYDKDYKSYTYDVNEAGAPCLTSKDGKVYDL